MFGSTADPGVPDGAAQGSDVRNIRVSLASDDDREQIYAMRHAVYAVELGQHRVRPECRLIDGLDAFNHYVVGTIDGSVAGFVSITPPGFGTYSIDKYVNRDELPFPVDDGLFEIRILTVDAAHRGGLLAPLLMYASLRWVEDHGASRVVIIGRSEVAELYERVGMRRLGPTVLSGAVTYELMAASVEEITQRLPAFRQLLARIKDRIDWSLAIPFERRSGAFHGGASHDDLGLRPSVERRTNLIAADVLDAWFPPAPGVLRALRDDPAFSASTSPPTDPTALRDLIADANGVDPAAILPGAGLSDLIFRCLPRWLNANARALVVEPQYPEYRHVLERLVGCRIESLAVETPDEAMVALRTAVAANAHELVVIVDPNNPLGYRLDSLALADLVTRAPDTRFWIDRTYAPFAGLDHALERLAARSRNVIVGMSMSKAYALSGLRIGYLCGPPELIADGWLATPPWLISRPAGEAAASALADPGYHLDRYRETRELRLELAAGLADIPGVRPRDGVANFVFCELDAPLDAATVVERAAVQGLYLRAFRMDPVFRWRGIRVAVQDRPTQRRLLAILGNVVEETRRARERVLVPTEPSHARDQIARS
jgi:histidinol-phosphate/aromatic aminotransferase/cobyric acid decarboxylase-like protein